MLHLILSTGKEEKHGNSTQAQCVFRQTRIRAVRRRCVGRVGKHLALPVSGRKIRRRHFSAHLHPAGCHLWLHHDHCRNGAGPDDPQKPGGRLQPFWQGEGAGVRRLDQRRHPHPDRSLLFGHRRMGHPLSGPVSHRPRQRWHRTGISPASSPTVCWPRSRSCCSPLSRWASSLRACATAWSAFPR